jgi:23S rRNA pseudouridine2605 synthase
VGEEVRLQKYLARAGVASRRASEDLIRQGRVAVNGAVVTELGTKVDPEAARVEVDGALVQPEPARWVMLHKPPGYLCTRSDPEGRPTVYDLLDEEGSSLFHVGRLDYMSEGLLLLTNEGAIAERLLHPRNEMRRRYEVTVAGPVPGLAVQRLRDGIDLDDGPARALRVEVKPGPGNDQAVIELTLAEGRNREVRRMMEQVGLTIHALKRVAFGPLALGDLPRGSWRPLEAGEIDRLRALNRNG